MVVRLVCRALLGPTSVSATALYYHCPSQRFHAQWKNELYRYNGTFFGLGQPLRIQELSLTLVPSSDSAPKKEMMGTPAFNNYLASLQALIGTHIDSIEFIEKKINMFRTRVRDGINLAESQIKLDENETELAKRHTEIFCRHQKEVERAQGLCHWVCLLDSLHWCPCCSSSLYPRPMRHRAVQIHMGTS